MKLGYCALFNSEMIDNKHEWMIMEEYGEKKTKTSLHNSIQEH